MVFAEGFRIDLLVDNRVIVELKSVERLAAFHSKQLLSSTGFPLPASRFPLPASRFPLLRLRVNQGAGHPAPLPPRGSPIFP